MKGILPFLDCCACQSLILFSQKITSLVSLLLFSMGLSCFRHVLLSTFNTCVFHWQSCTWPHWICSHPYMQFIFANLCYCVETWEHKAIIHHFPLSLTTSAERPDLTASNMLPLFLFSVPSLSGCGPSVCFGVREAPGVCVSEELEVLLPALHLHRLESWGRDNQTA